VAVLQSPEAWWGCREDSPVVPEDALGIRQLVREDGALVEAPVAVRILEPADAVGRVPAEVVARGLVARGVGHVEAAAIVEAGEHRMRDQWRPGDALRDKARWDTEGDGPRLGGALRAGPGTPSLAWRDHQTDANQDQEKHPIRLAAVPCFVT